MSEEDKKFDVFVSYSHSDVDHKWAETLVTKLKAYGRECWINKDKVIPGTDSDYNIQHALDEAKVCLVVLSDATNPPPPKLSKEWSAVQESVWRRDDLPVCYVKIGKAETPPFLRKWHSCNVDRSTNWQTTINEITKLLDEAQSVPIRSDNDNKDIETVKRFEELQKVIERDKEKLA